MDDNKDQILTDFQSCTGIEDVGEAIMYLESTNWNLLEAVTSVMSAESQTLPSRRVDIPMEEMEAGVGRLETRPKLPMSPNIDHPQMMNDYSQDIQYRLLNFKVIYMDNTINLDVPETETVSAIKTAIHLEAGVPPCRQELKGWNQHPTSVINLNITDDTPLSTLNLPDSTTLYLISPDHMNLISNSNENSFSRLDATYKFHVIDETNNKDYDLKFPGSKTVLEVKLDIADVTSIPVRFQRWVGWPESLNDDNIKLDSLDVSDRVLELILHRDENIPKPRKQLVVDITSSESDNEFEDAAECFGIDDESFNTLSSKRVQPLMPDGVDDELTAVTIFEKEFENRYGSCHPPFEGRFSEVLQASFIRSAKDRRPLAIYLHHDGSVLTNVFCTRLLCSETIFNYMTLNFVTWAWDLTHESNKLFLLAILTENLGVAAANAVRCLTMNSLPAIVVLTKMRSTPEVLTVIPGNVGLDDLMTRLINAVEMFNQEIQSEIAEEAEREARENVKREQDAAYEASLLADRAKEEVRRQEFEAKMKLEEKQMEIEQMRQNEIALKDAVRRSLADTLPPEPPLDNSVEVSHIRVRVPGGATVGRAFRTDTTLQTLLNYLASEGYPAEEYKVLASWPRIDLTSVEDHKTLEELKLYPKETLTIEER